MPKALREAHGLPPRIGRVFREMRRGDRILALLIEGEPADSFPASLREIREDQGPCGYPARLSGTTGDASKRS